jgi:hypothetical protein
LKIATKTQLSEYCRIAGLKISGTKDELIERLIEDGLELHELGALHLRALWKVECAAADQQDQKGPAKLEDVIIDLCAPPARTPSKPKVTSTKLFSSPPAPSPIQAAKPVDAAAAVDAKKVKKERAKKVHEELKAGLRPIAFTVDSPEMTREEYRKHLTAFVVMGADQDVFHIIAHANGGADHALNYHFAQNRAFNRAIGDKFDHINAFLAGKEQTRLAVEASKRWSGYTGPSADELYKQGEDFWRVRRQERRSDDKEKVEDHVAATGPTASSASPATKKKAEKGESTPKKDSQTSTKTTSTVEKSSGDSTPKAKKASSKKPT